MIADRTKVMPMREICKTFMLPYTLRGWT